jgi:hypothetical protein
MEDQAQHEMQLVQTHSSGAEEWHCPTCGRRFLMKWPPSYSKIVIEAGDEHALHSGGKGGLRLGVPTVSQADDTLFEAGRDADTSPREPGETSHADDENQALRLSDDLLAPWFAALEGGEDDES